MYGLRLAYERALYETDYVRIKMYVRIMNLVCTGYYSFSIYTARKASQTILATGKHLDTNLRHSVCTGIDFCTCYEWCKSGFASFACSVPTSMTVKVQDTYPWWEDTMNRVIYLQLAVLHGLCRNNGLHVWEQMFGS